MKGIIALLMVVIVVLSIPVAFAQDAAETTEGEPIVDQPVEDVLVEEGTAEDVAVEEPAVETEPVEVAPAEEVEPVVEDTAEAEILAEAEETAGVTPDSILYPIETTIDDIKLALTTDEAEKAQLAVEIADERLAETVVMAEEGKTEEAAEAQEQHDEAIATAEEAVEAIESDGDAEQAQEALEDIAEVQAAITGHAAKVAAVKDTILARMATKKSPEQLAHMEAVFNKIKAKAVEMETKSEAKKEKVKTKYKALSKKTDAEVDTEVAAIDEDAGLT
ncbi:hypothetical protein KY326_01770, partial [Candidatus Woesearchaeota archaeon]|nr:hypothetical protein [Candidatus Woesearchaeota archaeon]